MSIPGWHGYFEALRYRAHPLGTKYGSEGEAGVARAEGIIGGLVTPCGKQVGMIPGVPPSRFMDVGCVSQLTSSYMVTRHPPEGHSRPTGPAESKAQKRCEATSPKLLWRSRGEEWGGGETSD